MNLRWTILLCGCWIAVGAFSIQLSRARPSGTTFEHLDRVEFGSITAREIPFDEKTLEVLGVDQHRFLELQTPGGGIAWFYIGYYAAQRRNAQIHAPEHCYPGSGYSILESRDLKRDGTSVRELVVERRGEKRRVWFGYRTRWGNCLNPFQLKRDQILSSLVGRSRDAVLIRLSVPVGPWDDAADSRKKLSLLWDQLAFDVWQSFDEGASE